MDHLWDLNLAILSRGYPDAYLLHRLIVVEPQMLCWDRNVLEGFSGPPNIEMHDSNWIFLVCFWRSILVQVHFIPQAAAAAGRRGV